MSELTPTEEQQAYDFVPLSTLEQWKARAETNVGYWHTRVDMWEGEIIRKIEASFLPIEWTGEPVPTISDEDLESYFIGYWDAVTLYYRYLAQLRMVDNSIAAHNMANVQGEPFFTTKGW